MEPLDKSDLQKKMKPYADKLIAYFKSKCVEYSNDDLNENVSFTSSEKKATISHHSFYRYSGIACVSKDLGENKSEYIEVTDEMFMNNFMRPIIEVLLK
jgi:hypothetical protein